MKPSNSAAELLSLLEADSRDLSELTPRFAIAKALEFYANVAVDGCNGSEQDMLLYQWGTYNRGDGEYFELDLTRQFIEPYEDEEVHISQLHLTFKYEPTPHMHALGASSHWCQSQHELPGFRSLVAESAPYVVLADR